MRLEFIDNVKENEVLGKSILTYDGKILLRSGNLLTFSYIEKLKDLGVDYIYIEDDRLYDIDLEDEKLTKLKQNTIKSISNIVKNISSNRRLEVREDIREVENLVEYILENKDVNTSLYDIKTYDNYTYVHCLDTGIMATFLAMSLKISKEKVKELAIGAILHDVGKVKVPHKIISKNGRLTDAEFDEIKKHPLYGREILEKKFSSSKIILNTVAQHHERVDGRGYPYGLKSNEISRYGKIAAICDVYDAVSSDRCYRRKFSPNEAYELILGGSGTAFDEDLVDTFKKTFSIYPLGCKLLLSNGIEGYVCSQNKEFPDRPIIRVFPGGSMQNSLYYEMDLLKFSNITVVKVV
ncbi:HD-GYP domain-containing protein [Haloimpatiens sp. FM7315]|uniref:HD-GYP domain-containing protein n=1 Tax=Haloimpatiens sp. FM7315 TaxID=3298609 RepID=UPI00370BF356